MSRQPRRSRLLHVLAALVVLMLSAAVVESWQPLPRCPRHPRLSTVCRASSSSSAASSSSSAPAGAPINAGAAASSAPTVPRPLNPLPTLFEGDVVEYIITPRQREKGQLPPEDRRVLGLGVVNFEQHIHPLCQRKPGDTLLYYDEDQDALEEAAEVVVTRVLSQFSYSQRCIEDRRINPHGEEAEDVFEIEEALTEGCGPAIRY